MVIAGVNFHHSSLPLPGIAFLDAESVRPVVQRLDEQILACVEDEPLSGQQQSELLSWTHNHLLSAYVAAQLDAHLGPTAWSKAKRFIDPCDSTLETISQMVQSGVPLENDLTFRCPPSGCTRALALSRKLPAWLHRRITHAAQRTRLHTEAELAALWKNVEMYLLAGAIDWCGLADLLDADMPAASTLSAITRGCLEAVRGERSIVWTSTGAVLQA